MASQKVDVWKSSELVQEYLEGVRGAIPLAAEPIDVLMRLILARNGPVLRFLDLGCGDGILASAILEQFPQAIGVLLDFSQPMLQAARAQLSRYSANLQFVDVDYGRPGWVESVASSAPFEVVVSGYSIHHQPDEGKQALYAEIFHLLKPGGLFLNVEHVASATRWVESIFEEYFIDSLYDSRTAPDSSQNRGQVAETSYHRPDKEANILAPVETQCDWLRQIGFQDVDCYFKIFELAVFGGRRPTKSI